MDIQIDQAELDWLLNSPQGPVGKDLARRGRKVAHGARRRAPTYVRSGIESRGVAVDGEGLHVDIVSAATSKDGAPIGLFAEVGTKPHVIESKGDYPLRNAKTGQVFGKKVKHPGTQAQPHLRPALYEDIDAD